MKRAFVALLALTLTTLSGTLATADDEKIAKQIVDRLQQHRQSAQLQDFNIGVQVEDGTVTMMGNVASSDHAVLALDVARRIPGVKLVVNDLYVQTEAPAAPAPAAPASAAPALAAPAPAAPALAAAIPPVPAAPAIAAAPTLEAPALAIEAPQTVASPAIQPVAARSPAAPAMPAAQMTAQPTRSPIGSGVTGMARQTAAPSQAPLAFARSQQGYARPASYAAPEYSQARQASHGAGNMGGPSPIAMTGGVAGTASYDTPQMPGYAWPSYAAYPNYAAVTYPHQYSATAWPYIGPFYPYPQVPLGWRKVTLEWDDGWWFLDFKSK